MKSLEQTQNIELRPSSVPNPRTAYANNTPKSLAHQASCRSTYFIIKYKTIISGDVYQPERWFPTGNIFEKNVTHGSVWSSAEQSRNWIISACVPGVVSCPGAGVPLLSRKHIFQITLHCWQTWPTGKSNIPDLQQSCYEERGEVLLYSLQSCQDARNWSTTGCRSRK